MANSLRIGVFGFGSAGDVLPFARLAAMLARNQRTLLFAHSQYDDDAATLDIEYHAYDRSDQYQQLLADASWLNAPNTIPQFLRQHVLPRSAEIIALIEKKLRPGDLLVTPPLFDIAARVAAEKLNLRRVSAFLAPAQVTLSPLRTLMFERVLATEVNGLRQQHQLPPVTDWEGWLSYSNPAIGLWPNWFAAPQPEWIEGVTPIGFFFDQTVAQDLNHGVEEFLTAHPNPVLLTGGTGAFLDRQFYDPSIAAIVKSQLPGIVVTRYPDQLPDQLPDNLLVVERVPFAQLMPKMGLVIHHGGIGTTAEALRAGKPQLILALGADRPDNGARIERLGVGGSLAPAQWTPKRIADRIGALRQSQSVQNHCLEMGSRIAQDQALSADRETTLRQLVLD